MNKEFRNVSSFDRTERENKYQEDKLTSLILDSLNQGLELTNQLIEKTYQKSFRQSIIITGTPRSGTTFLYQLMASKLNYGYVSNLMARFYSAPFVGAWLHNSLIRKEISELLTFSSTHGVTDRVYEPHEFGYFWALHFPFHKENHEEVIIEELVKSLKEMEDKLATIADIFGRPVIYKCMIAPYILRHILGNTSVFVVHIRRNIDDVVDSILEVRRERLGGYDKWWSIRPANWRDLVHEDPRDQVRKQCESILVVINQAIVDFPQRVAEIDYEALVDDPKYVLKNISEKFRAYSLK